MTRSAAQVREEFIDFFRGKPTAADGHEFVPSSPVVPHDDPTLLFTNAGMNQFKPIFLGQAAPGSHFARLKRAANSQKCIRAGGKHNDLDDVGHDTYHHTFFEMLGNWSFGDYFKKEAIEWAWELLTKVWGLDKSRLHATYFEGDAAEGLEPDNEARELWASATDIDPSHIHPGNKKDNFWEMGDTGPCGPCSEIHIDLTPDKSGRALVNASDARVMEIWNLVFIQFNRAAGGKLTPLPARHVDTGMGLERVTAVIQGMERGQYGGVSNYDTDLFTPIFEAIHKVTGAAAYGGRLEEELSHRGTEAQREAVMRDVTYRVIADHIRTLTFAINDGAIPDKEGRGYVLRRILRRAVRYAWQYLDVHEPFLCKLVPAIMETMGGAFPELRKKPQRVIDIIRDEEESFERTLGRGIALFEEAASKAMQLANRGDAPQQSRALSDPSRELSDPSRARKEAVAPEDVLEYDPAHGPLAFFITFHTYGTWLHGADSGSVDRRRNIPDTPLLERSQDREASEAERLKHEPVTLDARRRGVVEATIREVAAHRGWGISALSVRTNHVHVVVSAERPPERVMNDFKSYATRRMVEQGALPPDTKVWTRHGSTRYLWKQADVAMACQYVEEGQGVDLPAFGVTGGFGRGAAAAEDEVKALPAQGRQPAQPLPNGRGSDQSGDFGETFPTRARGLGVISGEDAFRLHDTYGFPIDLTQIMAAEKGLTVDIDEYERLMEQARGRARGGDKSGADDDGADRLAPGECDDSPKYTAWRECPALIMSLARNTALGDTRAAKKGERIVFSTNRTCFYAEQGGQVSDTGWMSTATGRFHVDSVRRVTASMDLSDGPRLVQFFSHSGEVTEGEISIGQECVLRVSPEHRLPTMKNHTATHILNWALREILDPAGEHLQQKGSLVDPDKTRFDFSHNKPLAEDELERIEALCAAKIEENLTVYTNADEPVEKERALKLGQSLRAVFGEAYPDRVRVVSIGVPVTPEEAAKEGRSDSLLADPDNPEWRKYSIEFCGGTHVKSTGEIERFVLTHEEAVAKGVRRVVGVSGARARIVQEIGAALELEAAGLRNAERAELEPGVARLQKKFAQAHELPLLSRHRLREALARLQERVRQFHRADAAQAQDVVMDRVRELLASAERVGETTVLVAEMPDVPIDQLKTGADAVKQKCGSAAVLFGACVDRDTNPPGKAVLLAAMSDDLTKRGLKAGDLVKEVAKLVQGGGGGPPTMAQAGGKDPSKLAEALDAGRAWILAKLK